MAAGLFVTHGEETHDDFSNIKVCEFSYLASTLSHKQYIFSYIFFQSQKTLWEAEKVRLLNTS